MDDSSLHSRTIADSLAGLVPTPPAKPGKPREEIFNRCIAQVMNPRINDGGLQHSHGTRVGPEHDQSQFGEPSYVREEIGTLGCVGQPQPLRFNVKQG